MLLDRLEEQPSDSLIALIALAEADPRPDKIDVGVGVYRDAAGNTPILERVKAAERILVESQETKAYIGSQGDARFTELIKPLVFGEAAARRRPHRRPADAGRLRRAAARRRADRPGQSAGPHLCRRADLAQPRAADRLGRGRDGRSIPITPARAATICFDRMMDALGRGRGRRPRPPPRLLPQSDRRRPRPRPVARGRRTWSRRAGSIPFVDLAYQGFGDGLEADAAGTRLVVEAAEQALVAQSCDKNFGCYRDRLGNLFVKASSARKARDRVRQSARPRADDVVDAARPSGGGRRGSSSTIPSCAPTVDGRARGDGRAHPRSCARRLAAFDPRLAYIDEQNGMFSMLPLTPEQVLELRRGARHLHGGLGPVQRRRPLRRQCRPLRRRGGGEAG